MSTGRISPFSVARPLIGMVHLPPLPGSPRFGGRLDEVIEHAARDARRLIEAGFDAILVENYGDLPFHPGPVPAVTIASMTAVLAELRRRMGDSRMGDSAAWGVNVLRNDAAAALAIAVATGARFIRVNVHTGATVTDQGILQGRADETLRWRRANAPEVAVFADAQVKHGRSLREAALEEEVHDLVERGLADAVLITGARTGAPPREDDVVRAARAAGEVPVLVASGATPESAAAYLAAARGLIVGTALKRGGRIEAEIDPARARRMRAVFDAAIAARPGEPPASPPGRTRAASSRARVEPAGGSSSSRTRRAGRAGG